MRVALLSSIETLSDSNRTQRAFARIGGRTILQWQLEFAISAKCEQIACLSDGLHPELIDLQHHAEKCGVRFQVLRDIRLLSGLVRANDELLVLSDGLVFDAELLSDHLDNGKAVLTLPSDKAVPAGFERLDKDTAWAGAMLIGGAMVEKLADLPPDVDAQSSLLRISLQSGAKTVALAETCLTDGTLLIAGDEHALQTFEDSWLDSSVQTAGFIAPFNASADHAALAVIKRHRNPVKAVRSIFALAALLIAGALTFGYFGYDLAGLGFAGIAAIALRFSNTTSKALAGTDPVTQQGTLYSALSRVGLDGTLMALVAFAVPLTDVKTALFAMIMLVGLLRVLAMSGAQNSRKMMVQMIEDRGSLVVILIAGLLGGHLTNVIQVLAAILLITILVQFYSVRLTRA